MFGGTEILHTPPDAPGWNKQLGTEELGEVVHLKPQTEHPDTAPAQWDDSYIQDPVAMRTRRRLCICCILWLFNLLATAAAIILLWQILSAGSHTLVFGNRKDYLDSTRPAVISTFTEAERKSTTAQTSLSSPKTVSTMSTNAVFIPYSGTAPNMPDYDELDRLLAEAELAEAERHRGLPRRQFRPPAPGVSDTPAGGRASGTWWRLGATPSVGARTGGDAAPRTANNVGLHVRHVRDVAHGGPEQRVVRSKLVRQKLSRGKVSRRLVPAKEIGAILGQAARLVDELLSHNISGRRQNDRDGQHAGESVNDSIEVRVMEESALVKKCNKTEHNYKLVIRIKTIIELSRNKSNSDDVSVGEESPTETTTVGTVNGVNSMGDDYDNTTSSAEAVVDEIEGTGDDDGREVNDSDDISPKIASGNTIGTAAGTTNGTAYESTTINVTENDGTHGPLVTTPSRRPTTPTNTNDTIAGQATTEPDLTTGATSLPTSRQPTTGQPTTRQPTTGQPTTPTNTNDTIADQATTEPDLTTGATSLPTSRQPTTGQPTTGQPTTPTNTNDTIADQATTEPDLSTGATSLPTTPTNTDDTIADQATTESDLSTGATSLPTSRQPTTRQPTTRQETTRQQTTRQQTTRQPTTRQQTTRQPTTRQQTTRQPTTRQQTTRQQTTRQQTTRQQTTRQQTTRQPTTRQQTTVSSPRRTSTRQTTTTTRAATTTTRATTTTTRATTTTTRATTTTTRATTTTPRATTTTTKPPEPCPSEWALWRGSCYRAYEWRVKWKYAERFCRFKHAHLASIHSEEENFYLIGQFQPVCAQGACKAVTGIHIGLNDRRSEGHYVWTDGTAINLLKWSVGEPSNSKVYGGLDGEDCAELRVRFSFGNWNDVGCTTVKRPFVCKYPAYAYLRYLKK